MNKQTAINHIVHHDIAHGNRQARFASPEHDAPEYAKKNSCQKVDARTLF